MDFLSVFCVLVLLFSVLFVIRRWPSGKLPAGPFNPLGFMYGRSSSEAAENLLGLKQYGDVCCIRVVGTPCIYLNSHSKIRQYYVSYSDYMSGRIDVRGVKHRFLAGRGLILNDGLSWLQHRRFTLSTLRDFGFGRGGTEQIVQSELLSLLHVFATHQARPFDPRIALNVATCNVISLLVLGERCGSDPSFMSLYEMFQKSLAITNKIHDSVAVLLLKIVSRMPSFVLQEVMRSMEGVQSYMEAKVAEHKRNFNGETKDLIDFYLLSLQEQKAGKDANSTTFSDEALYSTITDLFFAGMETTASTLLWAILYLAWYPEVQTRVSEEIRRVLHSRLPTTADRKDLVYTEAAVLEAQRFASIGPLNGVHHRCTTSVKIDDFEIPQDSLIYANLFAVHRDERIWPDPHHFNPLNFYDEEQKSLKNTEYLYSFGVGKRSCLGESLAKQELFIFLTGIVQKFEISAPDLTTFPTPDDCFFGNVRMPLPFEICLKPRTSDVTNLE